MGNRTAKCVQILDHRTNLIIRLAAWIATRKNECLFPKDVHESVAKLLARRGRSEEHTSELQSQSNLVCRLLLEKKKTRNASATRVLFILLDYEASTLA